MSHYVLPKKSVSPRPIYQPFNIRDFIASGVRNLLNTRSAVSTGEVQRQSGPRDLGDVWLSQDDVRKVIRAPMLSQVDKSARVSPRSRRTQNITAFDEV